MKIKAIMHFMMKKKNFLQKKFQIHQHDIHISWNKNIHSCFPIVHTYFFAICLISILYIFSLFLYLFT